MADERPRKATTSFTPAPSPDPMRRTQDPLGRARTAAGGIPVARDPRAALVVPIRYRYESIIDFIETQSVNVSRSGMFVSTNEPLPLGTLLDFEFTLTDGFVLLRGRADVVRVSHTPPRGLGLRFQHLDEASRRLIERILEVNLREGRRPTVSMDFAPSEASDPGLRATVPATGPGVGGIAWKEDHVSIQLDTATVSYFVYNPLLNIRLGGFVIPAERDVPLGTIFGVTISVLGGETLFSGKGKVVAKHERRLGIRLSDVEKPVLARLQAEVARLAPSK